MRAGAENAGTRRLARCGRFRFTDITVEYLRDGKQMAVTAKPGRLDREAAEAIAVQGLTYLAGEPEALGRFLALTGIGPADLRRAAAEDGFLAGVLEFFLEDETLLLAFVTHANLRPTMVAAARHTLGGHLDA
jgi:hypothetical protein